MRGLGKRNSPTRNTALEVYPTSKEEMNDTFSFILAKLEYVFGRAKRSNGAQFFFFFFVDFFKVRAGWGRGDFLKQS